MPTDHDRLRDALILRDGDYSYDQSAHLYKLLGSSSASRRRSGRSAAPSSA